MYILADLYFYSLYLPCILNKLMSKKSNSSSFIF